MQKFQDVDLINALQKIVNNNNLHYKSDFKYDSETLKNAAVGDRFLWMSRYSGTWLIPERNAHIRNTYDYNTWQYYTDAKYYGVKAFAVEVKENNNGNPFGDIYQLHYNRHIENVRRNSFNAKTVDVHFKPQEPKSKTGYIHTFEIAEYNDNWHSIVNRYGEVESVRHNLSGEDTILLEKILHKFKMQYEAETTPGNINDYVREMVKERFHEYGYTKDDMVFTTPDDAYVAVKHKIPVQILHPDNRAEQASGKKDIEEAVHAQRIFGMSAKDKQLLNFFTAGNTFANLPFSRDELKAILFMALDKGKENIPDEKDRQIIDNIIYVVDTVMFASDSHDEFMNEHDYELEESEEFEP
jgi:hypothetical protein